MRAEDLERGQALEVEGVVVVVEEERMDWARGRRQVLLHSHLRPPLQQVWEGGPLQVEAESVEVVEVRNIVVLKQN